MGKPIKTIPLENSSVKPSIKLALFLIEINNNPPLPKETLFL